MIMIIVFIVTKRFSSNTITKSYARVPEKDEEHDSLYDKPSGKDKENPFLMD